MDWALVGVATKPFFTSSAIAVSENVYRSAYRTPVRPFGTVYGATDGVNACDCGVYVPNGVEIGWVMVTMEEDSIGKRPIRPSATMEQNCENLMKTSLKGFRAIIQLILLIIYLNKSHFKKDQKKCFLAANSGVPQQFS